MKKLLWFITGMLVVLKLANVIEWSWIWVFSPLWLPLSIVGIPLIIMAVKFPEEFSEAVKKF